MLRKFKSKTKSKEKTTENVRDEKSRRVKRDGDDRHKEIERNDLAKEGRRMSTSSNVSSNTRTIDSNEKSSRRSSIRLPHSATSTTFSLGNSNIGSGCNNINNGKTDCGNNLKKANSSLAVPEEPLTTTTTTATTTTYAPPRSMGCKEELAHKRVLNVIPQSFTLEEAKKLEFEVINPLDPQLPYGDGSGKLFGVENFGRAILEFPPRENPKQRRRKFTVPGRDIGKLPHALTTPPNSMSQQNYANRTGSSSPVIPATPNSQSSSANLSAASSGMRKLSLFSRSNMDSSTSVFSSIDNSEGGENGNNENGNVTYSQTDFTVSDSHKDVQLEKVLTEKYPALKEIEINYFLNSQKNVTLVGIINDPSALLEWRKKAALIRGPIINLDEPFLSEYGMKEENMFTVIKDAFECITENASKTGVLSPYNLIEVIKRENILFRNAQHQDAHEFLNFLINNVLESMKQYNKESIITDIFEGELTSETKCLTCDNSSYRNEKFLDLSIDLEPDSSITNCLKMFSKIEMLNENNKFYCENCYSYQEAAKSIKLRKIPKILAFHLKRFKYSEKLDRLVKLFYRVEYVKTLRICNTTKDSEQPDKLYELYGVVVHIGGGPYHGHYVSLVKTELYGWLLFDDETVEKIDEDYVFKFFGDGCGLATAYLLFYREVEDEQKFFNEQLYNGLDDGCDGSEDEFSGRGNLTENKIPAPAVSRDDENNRGVINHHFTFKKSATSSNPSVAPSAATTDAQRIVAAGRGSETGLTSGVSSAIGSAFTTPLEQSQASLPHAKEPAPLRYTTYESYDEVDDFDPFSQVDHNDVNSANYLGEHISNVTTKSTIDTTGTGGTTMNAINEAPKNSQRRRSSMFRGLSNDSPGNVSGSFNGVSASEHPSTGSRRSSLFGFRKKSVN